MDPTVMMRWSRKKRKEVVVSVIGPEPTPKKPILEEGEHLMRVTEVRRNLSTATENPYWTVRFHRVDAPRKPDEAVAAYILYSEAPQALWKMRQDCPDGPAEMLGKEYTVRIRHVVFQSELRMEASIIHPEPETEITMTIKQGTYQWKLSAPWDLPPGEYEAKLIIEEEA